MPDLKIANSWRDRIITALENLEGNARLKSIYAEIERQQGSPLTRGMRAGIRRELENHSSDSKNYRTGRADLFYSFGGIGSGHWGLRSHNSDLDSMLDGVEAFIETNEGRAKLRLHLVRERSRHLIVRFKASLSSLACEVCDFKFQEVYGELGAGFIEAHHVIPIGSYIPA